MVTASQPNQLIRSVNYLIQNFTSHLPKKHCVSNTKVNLSVYLQTRQRPWLYVRCAGKKRAFFAWVIRNSQK